MDELYVNGDVPQIEGKRCEAFLCQDYRAEGVVEDRAYITHVCFEGAWYRLYFEPFLIFWRSSTEAPEETREPGFEFGLEDIGTKCHIKGALLISLAQEVVAEGVKVKFSFENGRSVSVLHRNDRAEVECS
ncbi:MAG: hypothetical protein CO186_05025 [Zetaproteobacteria bacterium CG_4_9_14_3_um_filter_49_83]|jgi:hypothetical protein|nr:MAG: hypothetical protein AUJ56_01295 [Zetaproteobacteria bacterium CG1_02_49_23]PIQ30632.1 MAG: hypothetical protein COW62_11860 [Zetaproteobacteria bacterium CG17_big_fil_post_rev_8_21_14_2_50_50_13]PIV30115.1 MAG: hypothetical protein COS35_08410 [Zetaproteobacteria bacterium CG02_land_8_20_14_3_00_50_9]PIY54719.1 MAG: hypothetical protein COZ00_13240 [Zetaproteobacteria bacterium CG_4_10_14_0_8_um_filter_49_80]PJA35598.1 MAG: hypothetical protein CO186_05025 [Zetaproteobacteria bacterium